jgi:hypothetical protein
MPRLGLRQSTREWEAIAVTETKLIRIMCPNLGCQRILAVPVHTRGKLVRCKGCGMTIRIPAKSSPAAGGETQEPAA